MGKISSVGAASEVGAMRASVVSLVLVAEGRDILRSEPG